MQTQAQALWDKQTAAHKGEALAAVERMTFPAGTVWTVGEDGELRTSVSRPDDSSVECCPMTAWNLTRGDLLPMDIIGWKRAAKALGVSVDAAKVIIQAADNFCKFVALDTDVRAALLRKCGIKGSE